LFGERLGVGRAVGSGVDAPTTSLLPKVRIGISGPALKISGFGKV
jgi:hypothetical protein